jgi:membrane dipeptidase
VAAHVKHAVAIAGEEAVAIGTDFDGMPSLPMDLSGFQDLPRLADALKAVGIGAATLEKVMWRNAARVLRAGLREG